ncbi:MAG: YncE family protein [Myxococcales bacterium]|nr:YncE family protein [Myxococcales bacterium]
MTERTPFRRATLARLTVGATALLVLAKLTACSSSGDENPGAKPGADAGDVDGGPTGPTTIAAGPSRGSAVAVSGDDSVVVMVNRDAGSVSVFKVTYPDEAPPQVDKVADVAVGGEPWQVVISPDGATAYVVLRKDQKLVRIVDLKGAPKVDGEAKTGSEPTGVALTPSGARAWVANWVDGTLSGIDTKTMATVSTVDLNASLVATGLLGDVQARPSLAHPRSVSITNNGDPNDDDESIYVTEYYAQRTERVATDGSNADLARSAIVYKVKIADKSVSTIRLAPIADMGFKDSAGGQAGCFPNQLQSITIHDKYAYVASICASPKGPTGVVTPGGVADVSNVKTTTHGAVSVIDLASDKEVTGATASLNARFDGLYTARSTPDDGSRRYPGVPVDVGFVRGGGVGYVASNAGDAVFRVQYDLASGSSIGEVGAPNQLFINLSPATAPAGKQGQNPIGIATAQLDAHKRFAFVANDATRNLAVIDFNTQSVAGTAEAPVVQQGAAMPTPGSLEDKVRKGKRFFNTGVGRWSLKGQAWGACQSCHADGLTDNVTWYFARGPRQSTSLDGTFSKKDPNDQRILNWTAIFDEVADFELNTRGISGGVGATVHTKSTPPSNGDRIDLAGLGHAGLSGSAEQAADPANPAGLAQAGLLSDWDEIKEYMRTIRPPRGATNVDAQKVAEGRKLFAGEGSCQGCHGGDKWTISKMFYAPSAAKSAELNAKAWTPPPGFPASLLPAADVDKRFMRFGNGNPGAFDQIQCILRPVGTFNVADTVSGIAELRGDMSTPGQGDEVNGRGFNPPSLLGLQTGAPYLHAGGASSLESLFSPTFKDHYAALAPNFLSETDPQERAKKIDQLVHFLLSVDASTPVVAAPTSAGAQGGSFCAE